MELRRKADVSLKMETLLFDFDFTGLQALVPAGNANELYERQAGRKRKHRAMLGIKQHDKLKALSRKRLTELILTARDKLKVGFELEFNDVSYAEAERELQKLGIITGTQSPLKTTYKTQEFYSDTPYGRKIKIELPETIDMFKERELIAYAYNDGSVPLEIVTTAYNLNLFEIESNLRKIHNLVRRVDKKATCNCLKNCGLHQTFCFELRKDSFDRVVTANIFQICRAFSSGMLHLFSFGSRKTRTRDLQFRALNSSVWLRNSVRTNKYSFVNNKNDELLEFRWVDGCNSPFLSALCALFNCCVIKKAVRLSEFGVLIIDSSFFRKNNTATTDFASMGKMDDKFIRFNALKLLSFLERELREAGIYEHLLHLFKKPIWQRDFDRDNLRSWREQESKIKGAVASKQEQAGNELAALLCTYTHAFERGGT